MLLFFIRHGHPTYSPDALTELGHLQAHAVAKRLCRHGIDRVFTSPCVRARQTAQPTCDIMRLEAQVEDWTSEVHAWNDFSSVWEDGRRRWICARPNHEFMTPHMLSLGYDWMDDEFFKDINARKGYQRIVDASDDFFRRLGYEREGARYKILQPNEERIALFAHAGYGVIWLSHMFHIPTPQAWGTFDLGLSAVTIFEFRNYEGGYTAPYCLCHADLSHLYGEGLPMKYNNRIYL